MNRVSLKAVKFNRKPSNLAKKKKINRQPSKLPPHWPWGVYANQFKRNPASSFCIDKILFSTSRDFAKY